MAPQTSFVELNNSTALPLNCVLCWSHRLGLIDAVLACFLPTCGKMLLNIDLQVCDHAIERQNYPQRRRTSNISSSQFKSD